MTLSPDGFLGLNLVMDGLCLAVAARWLGVRMPVWRCLAAMAAGGVCALAALAPGGAASSLGALALGAAVMAALAFPRAFVRGMSALWAVGLLLCGVESAAKRFLPGGWTLGCCYLSALGLALWPGLRPRAARDGTLCTVRLHWRGRWVVLAGRVDTGNDLWDGLTGCPVLVASGDTLGTLLPGSGWTLQRGVRLIRARTVSGDALLPCFRPDRAEIRWGKRKIRCDMVVAVSMKPLSRALVPGEAVRMWGTVRKGRDKGCGASLN